MGVKGDGFTDGITPICDDCGVALCWDISVYEYMEDPDFWDDWCCKDCKPEYRKWKMKILRKPKDGGGEVKFKPGDTVAFDPESFNPDYWDDLTLEQKEYYYGDLYDFQLDTPVLFTFLCEHSPQVGHCVLVNMSNQKVETMRHTNNFRLVTDDEC